MQKYTSDFSQHALENYHTYLLEGPMKACKDSYEFYKREIELGYDSNSNKEYMARALAEYNLWVPVVEAAKKRDARLQAEEDAMYNEACGITLNGFVVLPSAPLPAETVYEAELTEILSSCWLMYPNQTAQIVSANSLMVGQAEKEGLIPRDLAFNWFKVVDGFHVDVVI